MDKPKLSNANRRVIAVGVSLGIALTVVLLVRGKVEVVRATPPDIALPLPPATSTAGDAGAQEADQEAAPDMTSPDVQIVISTFPQAQATVNWGKQRLGKIEPGKPLVVTRPRDSGPLDVLVRANGFLPVQTRAHTFSSNKLQVRLTRPDQTTTLVGYRVPLDAGVEAIEAGTLADFAP